VTTVSNWCGQTHTNTHMSTYMLQFSHVCACACAHTHTHTKHSEWDHCLLNCQPACSWTFISNPSTTYISKYQLYQLLDGLQPWLKVTNTVSIVSTNHKKLRLQDIINFLNDHISTEERLLSNCHCERPIHQNSVSDTF
jgi:hypothetical protein